MRGGERMNEYLRMTVRRFCSLIRHRGKALGLSSAHRIQRHEDGSYTITIRLVPEGVNVDVGSVDGIVISQHRSFGVLNG